MIKYFVIGLLLAHFVGDWLCQSRNVALNKSKDFRVLFEHLLIVSFFLVFATAGLPFSTNKLGLLLLVNAVLHGIIDWNIWRIYGKIRGDDCFETEPTYGGKPQVNRSRVKHDYWFYSTIAIDQFLHLSIIFSLFL